jgi:UDP-N-acetylmuramoylalanine--D-glutamate ligase
MADVVSRQNLSGKHVSVIGAARSGVAVARLLAHHGARVFVSDRTPPEKLRQQTGELASIGVQYETGGHTNRVLECDLLVLSPGVPSDLALVIEARERGIPVLSELEVASWFCPAPMVAVTGTNGKTTTTALIGRMLHDAKKKHVVAGNIGMAFSGAVHDLDERSIAVLEVSSFQLDEIDTFHPHTSIILNITPDHLDRYGGSFARYIDSKCRVFANQTMDDFVVYNYDDAVTREAVEARAGFHTHIVPLSVDHTIGARDAAFVENDQLVLVFRGTKSNVLPTKEISLRGKHNLYNAMAATLVAAIHDVSIPSIRATLRNFKGVEHRLEFVREVDGVQYVNDSKATNVGSTWYALQAFDRPIVLLLGGRDKGNDYTKLIDMVRRSVKAIVAIGESAGKVNDAFRSTASVVVAQSMEEAVRLAKDRASSGDVVLLSPACASFDWFENYEHRGQVFKQLVNGL